MKFFISLVISLGVVSCSAEHYETKARIIERRMIGEDDILIKYSFSVGNDTIVDSVRTRNKVIPHDSLVVRYSPGDPKKNSLKFD